MAQPPTSAPPPDPGDSSILVSVLSDEPEEVRGASTAPLQPPRGSRNTRLIAAVALFALLLAIGGLWWVFGRGPADGTFTPGASGLPDNAVAFINSSAPITLRIPAAGEDKPGEVSHPPDSAQWSAPVREAYRALSEGRYPSALSQFSALVGGGSGPDAREALWGLAETYETSGQPDLALRAYTLFSNLDDPRAIRAVYRAALLHEQAGRDKEAARLFGSYAALGGPAKHSALLRQARLLGPTAEAEAIYNAILNDNPIDTDMRSALMLLGDVQARRDNHAAAREIYVKLAEIQKTAPRPLLDRENLPAIVLAAEEARLSGDETGARKFLLSYIGNGCTDQSPPCLYYPFGRHSAINGLLKIDPEIVASGTVSPMLAAQTAFDAGYDARAVQYLDLIRTQIKDPAQRAKAALLTGRSYQASGNSTLAYNWYTATVQVYPQSPEAPEGIRRAADMLERQGQWDPALLTYLDALARYPNAGEETLRTRLNGGLLAYRLDKPEQALEMLLPARAARPTSTTLQAEIAFWTAKVEKQMGAQTWRDTIRPVSTLVPGTYLDFRSRSLLEGEPEGGPLAPTFVQSNMSAEKLETNFAKEEAERNALLSWAAQLSSSPPPQADTPPISPTLTLTPTESPTTPRTHLPNLVGELDRAMLLVELGDRGASFSLRVLAESMAQAGEWEMLARLVLYARYHTDPRTALRVADRLDLSAGGDPITRPLLLLKTLYPAPYSELVIAESKERDIDPLIVYALMRQESQFVPTARSSADARGLTQVIPSTAKGIADQLNDTGYKLEDLYLPHVSIRYGTYYLESNLPQFSRKLLPSLAAYNGGPGNASRWLDGSALRDPDLYIQRIDLFETEGYLRVVYSNYGMYRIAYSSP